MIGKVKIEVIKKKTITILDKYLENNYSLILFGSFAKNNIDRISDIDLAVYSEDIIPAAVIAKVKEELQNKPCTLRNIELVNLTEPNISNKLIESISKEGILWKVEKNSKELLKNLKKRLKNSKK